jgi:hypothetical protein
MDFSSLRKNSGKNSLEKLTKELSKLNQQSEGGKDTRFWYPNVDKAGNGYSVIRFLPAPGEEEVPFIRMFEHGFKGPSGTWYIENSLTTINQPDPVSEFNSKLWNSTTDDESPARKQVRVQKRKLNFVANIYVIQDQMNPENNGKVFLYKFGKKIYDKLNEAMNPQFEDEDPMNPFDFWAGANFKLKIRNVEGYRNYDKSEFSTVSPLFDSDEQMENAWKQEHSLQAFLAPSNFKSYDELKAKLNKVLGLTGSGGAEPAVARAAAANRKPDPIEDDAPWADPKPLKEAPARSAPSADEDDDDMAFFSKLANK